MPVAPPVAVVMTMVVPVSMAVVVPVVVDAFEVDGLEVDRVARRSGFVGVAAARSDVSGIPDEAGRLTGAEVAA